MSLLLILGFRVCISCLFTARVLRIGHVTLLEHWDNWGNGSVHNIKFLESSLVLAEYI
jgi:hypothetical protein